MPLNAGLRTCPRRDAICEQAEQKPGGPGQPGGRGGRSVPLREPCGEQKSLGIMLCSRAPPGKRIARKTLRAIRDGLAICRRAEHFLRYFIPHSVKPQEISRVSRFHRVTAEVSPSLRAWPGSALGPCDSGAGAQSPTWMLTSVSSRLQ